MNFLKRVLAKLKDKTITWVVPSFEKEVGEYLENVPTKEFFESHDVVFKNKEEVISFLEKGSLKEVSESDLNNTDNLDTEEKYFDSNYIESFKKMEDSLLEDGNISLPAPIFIETKSGLYLFAGNRRVTLATKYKLPVKVWMVPING